MSHQRKQQSIEEILLHANPNPNRVGCLSSKQLMDLATGKRGAGDHLYVHVSGCSECYGALLRRSRESRRTKVGWLLVAATILLLASVAVWYRKAKVEVRQEVVVAKAEQPLPKTLVDLRPFAIARSAGSPGTTQRLGLNRRKQQFVFVLPVASATGEYDLRLLDADLSPKLLKTAAASLRDGSTELSIDLDLSAVSAGHYTLALRREPEDWRYYPVDVE